MLHKRCMSCDTMFDLGETDPLICPFCEEDSPDSFEDTKAMKACPVCKGKCEDMYGNPCAKCNGEGRVEA